MVSAEALAAANIQLFLNTFNLTQTFVSLLLEVSKHDLWNVTYGFLSFGYWVSVPFFADNATLDIAAHNETALAHFKNATDYLGKNSKRIFGAENADTGLSAIMRDMIKLVDEKFVIELYDTIIAIENLLIEMLKVVSSSLPR